LLQGTAVVNGANVDRLAIILYFDGHSVTAKCIHDIWSPLGRNAMLQGTAIVNGANVDRLAIILYFDGHCVTAKCIHDIWSPLGRNALFYGTAVDYESVGSVSGANVLKAVVSIILAGGLLESCGVE